MESLLFVARGAGVSLTVFVLLYLAMSFLVSRLWKPMARACARLSPQLAANLLFVVRLLPLLVSVSVTVAVTLPSFLLLEPRATDEPVGVLPLTLGICCLLVFAAGLVRALTAQTRASRAMSQWLRGATLMEARGAVPVLRTGNHAPALTVAGVYAPKVLVSENTVTVLTPSELSTALKHELAHVRRYDNLKKLALRFLAFPGMVGLESAWSDATEMAADDDAVSNMADALDLATALIKLSRLAPVQPSSELSTALLPGTCTSLRARVERLYSWSDALIAARRERAWWYVLPPALAVGICLATVYSAALAQMHAATEWLVR